MEPLDPKEHFTIQQLFFDWGLRKFELDSLIETHIDLQDSFLIEGYLRGDLPFRRIEERAIVYAVLARVRKIIMLKIMRITNMVTVRSPLRECAFHSCCRILVRGPGKLLFGHVPDFAYRWIKLNLCPGETIPDYADFVEEAQSLVTIHAHQSSTFIILPEKDKSSFVIADAHAIGQTSSGFYRISNNEEFGTRAYPHLLTYLCLDSPDWLLRYIFEDEPETIALIGKIRVYLDDLLTRLSTETDKAFIVRMAATVGVVPSHLDGDNGGLVLIDIARYDDDIVWLHPSTHCLLKEDSTWPPDDGVLWVNFPVRLKEI